MLSRFFLDDFSVGVRVFLIWLSQIFSFLVRVDITFRVPRWTSKEPKRLRFPEGVSVICLASCICQSWMPAAQRTCMYTDWTLDVNRYYKHKATATTHQGGDKKFSNTLPGKCATSFPWQRQQVWQKLTQTDKGMVNRRWGTNNRVHKLCGELSQFSLIPSVSSVIIYLIRILTWLCAGSLYTEESMPHYYCIFCWCKDYCHRTWWHCTLTL